MRQSTVTRKTGETDITLTLNLDGSGNAIVDSGCGFLDHMLTLFAKHSGFDLTLTCKGDTYVDDHHTVEDVAICLGKAFADALGDCRGISRYGNIILPMDEALVMAAVDISGRNHLVFESPFPTEKIGTFDTELIHEFWAAFTREARITLHIRLMSGFNSHHIAEAGFKAVARALRTAVAIDPTLPNEIPSTKGLLS